MKKLSTLLMAFLAVISVFAEKGTMIISSPTSFQVLAVSPNGKWACGVSGDGISSTEKGVLWNMETGEMTYLSTTGSSVAYDVSDDGTVVGSGGYYKDGAWHRFDNSAFPGAGGGTHFAISKDGRYVAGYVMMGGDYAPAKWVDGKLAVIYPYDNGVAQCYAISDDGQYAAGWGYTTTGDAPLNRTIALWTDTTVEYLSKRASFAEAGRHFSSDNSLLLCEAMGHKFVYNLNTKEKLELPFYSLDCSNQILCYVNNDGVVLGGEEMFNNLTGQSDVYGYVYDDGKAWDMNQWLKEKHNVEIDPQQYKIYRGVQMSEDGKVIAMLAYTLQNGALTADYVSLVVMLDREVDICPPVTLTAEKIRGVNKVRVTWKEPMMNAANVLGYNLYRDNQLIVEGISEMAYIDEVPAEGTYSYTATALYEGEGDEFVESEHSVPVTINVVDEPINKARNIETHAVNYNDLKLRWGAPESNLPSLTYFNSEGTISGFGGGLVSFSAAIRLPYDIVNNYAESHVIARVAFMPRNPEARYTIKVYVNGDERVSQPVDNATLSYNNMNTIDLDTPITFNGIDNILVAVDVDATSFSAASNDVIGMSYGEVVTGYSDLLRQLVEPEYYSLNQSSLDAGYGEMAISWAISAIFAELDANGKPNVECDILDGYDLYRNNELISTTEQAHYYDENLASGFYTYGVAARYADGSVAEPTTFNVNFRPKSEVLTAVDNVDIEADINYVNASWEAPRDNDATVISHAGSSSSGRGITRTGATDLIEYTVAHDYSNDYFDWYEGYYIESLRFYPTAEATFAIALEVNGIDYDFIVLNGLDEEGGYTLNTWNNVKLTTPYQITNSNSIRIKLVCSDVDPSTYPICTDRGRTIGGVSDLYSWDYSRFSSANADGGVTGSWMLGMNINNGSSQLLPVKGYNVELNGEQLNDALVTETSYQNENLSLKNGSTNRMRVNTIFDVEGEPEVKGSQIYFNVQASVERIEIDRVKVYPNPATSYITVEGECERVVLLDMSGRIVAETSADVVDVTSLPVGSYLLNIYRESDVETVKVLIVR